MYHIPVLVNECVVALDIDPAGMYVDATFGGGGHARAIYEKLNKKGTLIAFDQDADAAAKALEWQHELDSKDTKGAEFIFVNQNFRHLKRFLKLYHAIPVNGIFADFGISSHQIDTDVRGFSLRWDAPLDMRMNQMEGITAFTVVNTYSEKQLQDIFSSYAEITNAKTLAAAIVAHRAQTSINTTFELKNLALSLAKGKPIQYLAKVFQAIRMEVNNELLVIEEFLEQTVEVLKPNGRLVTLSYHSLEDRLVKDFTKTGNFKGEHIKDDFGNIYRPFKLITNKPIIADEKEMALNSRSRSVKMRIAAFNEQVK